MYLPDFKRPALCLAIMAAFYAPASHVHAESMVKRLPIIGGLIEKSELRNVIEADGLKFFTERDRPVVAAFYNNRNYKPVWTGRTDEARKVEQILQVSWAHGLNPKTYHVSEIAKMLKDPEADTAQLELLLTDAVIRYSHDMTGFRLNPASIGQMSKYWRQPMEAQQALETVVMADDPAGVLKKLEPTDKLYTALRGELIRLTKQEAALNRLEPVDFGGVAAKPGHTYPHMDRLRARMGISYDETFGPETLYDDRLAAAVMAFQKRNGMKGDGIIGPKSLSLLNQSPRARMEQIIANMERLRWLDGSKPDRYVLVNIPSQMLWAVDKGKVAMQMAVVVGKVDRPTKAFRTNITGIRFNPRWTVPQSIKMKDFLPILREDPTFLAQKGIEVYTISDKRRVTIDPAAVDWTAVSPAEMNRMHMVQTSGDHNSLGRIRVLMPNDYDIYLHDTNHRELFSKDERFMSSGCIRLSDPEKMARFVLDGQKGWQDGRMQTLLATGAQRDVPIDSTIPIYILYQTVWLDKDGKLVFGPDIYGNDRQLAAAMGKAQAYWLPGIKPPKPVRHSGLNNSQVAVAD